MVNFVIIDINYKLDTIIKFVSKLIHFFLLFKIKVDTAKQGSSHYQLRKNIFSNIKL